jgi:predicted transposase/invertase (TIGR01784 family)
MTKLKYTFKNDLLFKMIFIKYPHLLKHLISKMLRIKNESIGHFIITNPEIPPDFAGEKFCRLDINMTVDNQRLNLEIQVRDGGDYPERSLYYWAREYSAALAAGGHYSELPRTIVINILAFKLFSCEEFYSEFQILEVTRHTPLTNRLGMLFYELPKLLGAVCRRDGLKLWLMLFNAETEEELKEIEALGVPEMQQAIDAYRQVTATDEFKELERMRFYARHNEASALHHATEVERKRWQGIVADKDAAFAAALADKDAVLADKDALIAELQAKLGGRP